MAGSSHEDPFLSESGNQSKDMTDSKKKKKFRCNVKLLRRRFPIVGWLPNYSLNYSVFDLIAGITVGLTIIPQSIAYAGVAGLPFEVRILDLIISRTTDDTFPNSFLIMADLIVNSTVSILLLWVCLPTPCLALLKNRRWDRQLLWLL
jgi:hypothetical protein